MNRVLLVAAAAVSLLLMTSCSSAGGHEPATDSHATVLELANKHTKPNDNGGVRIDEAFGRDVLVPVEIKGEKFAIRSREATMDKFPCQRCHKVPLAQMKHDGKDGKAKAHWNITMKHAEQQVMSCSTCHLESDSNQLRTLGNHAVKLDESYRVCAQCHSKQASDWAGGAHGKRVGGWAPPRVAKTCAECHNPHSPAWDHRYPARVTRREDKPGHE